MNTSIYIPFNMIIDIDSGVLRLIEKVEKIDELPNNKLKSFLLRRHNENPILEYCKLRDINVLESTYDIILEKFYKAAINLSLKTDLIGFIINTYKLGVSNEVIITVGCNNEYEIEYINSVLSSFKIKVNAVLSEKIDLNEYDCIFTKVMDEYYLEYLTDIVKIHGKKIYVADYMFNTINDTEKGIYAIDPAIHIKLESNGNILFFVSVYNKK